MRTQDMSSGLIYTLRRTLTTFALSCPNTTAGLSPVKPNLLPSLFVAAPRPYSTCTVISASAAADFTPPPPPTSKGQPVFNDIDLTQKSPEAIKRCSDQRAVFVVTGANRGIGLQFVKSLLGRTEGTIVACCRSPKHAQALDAVRVALPSDQQGRIQIQQLDVEDQASIESAAEAIKAKYNRVDLLLNVAGLLGDGKTTSGPERSLSKIDRNWLEKNLRVNAVGPIMLTQALSPLMQTKRRVRKKTANGEEKEEERATSVVASLSARVGSISDNELGGWYSYRLSKSALNQFTRTAAHELKRQGTWSVALHPGTTDTDLSKPFQRNVQDGRLFPVDFTVSQLLDVIDGMDDTKSGGLYDWSGKALPF